MRLVHTKDLTPGMIVGCDVISEDGVILLAKGVCLSKSHIATLQNLGITMLYVDTEESNEIDNKKAARAYFIKEYIKTIGIIVNAFEDIKYFKEVPIFEMRELADQRIKLLINTIGVLDYLQELRLYNGDTFQHSLNVAILAGVLGKWLGYEKEKLKNLILAGLLHDIGKLFVPLSILDKPHMLSSWEFEVIKKHPQEGYRLIADSNKVPENVKLGILQHHERMDKSGYPLGLEGDKIHDYAKIIAIADIYDAMTSDRPYRRRMTPLAVIEEISAQMYSKLDAALCLTFLNNVKNHFQGSDVILSNGQKAKIIILNENLWTKPIVCTADGRVIDLQDNEISILDLIEEGKISGIDVQNARNSWVNKFFNFFGGCR